MLIAIKLIQLCKGIKVQKPTAAHLHTGQANQVAGGNGTFYKLVTSFLKMKINLHWFYVHNMAINWQYCKTVTQQHK